MKQVKNRRTGDVGELDFDSKEGTFIVVCYDLNTKTVSKTIYTRLEDLYDEWEDYEEQKKYWGIDYTSCRIGGIDEFSYDNDSIDEFNKAIGNYFGTKEEAEKAVEKLKAWKRLRDKGFRFTGWATNEGIRGVDFEVPDSFFSEHNHSCISDETRDDLDLLFGGEE